MIKIHKDFIGGNIFVEKLEGDTAFVEREKRDTNEWFYWAFCVEGAQGRTLKFQFPSDKRVGRFGAAVSHDLENWHWQDENDAPDSFTYTFAEDEDKVYFAHHILYPPHRFFDLAKEKELEVKSLCMSRKGRSVPFVTFGSGEKCIIVTARHHACESTGSYVLEGMLGDLIGRLPDGYTVIAVPFVDYDGVLDGDQGKDRIPHDHNRDYIDSPIYPETAAIMELTKKNRIEIFMDFHSPYHMWDVNDTNFFSFAKSKMIEVTEHFGEIMREECAGLELRYEKKTDVYSNTRWNSDASRNSKNFMSDIPGIKLSLSTETTYFGVEGNKVSRAALLELGRAYARTLLRFISES